MKKKLSIIIILCLTLTIGCGGSSSGGASQDATSGSDIENQDSAPVAEPLTSDQLIKILSQQIETMDDLLVNGPQLEETAGPNATDFLQILLNGAKEFLAKSNEIEERIKAGETVTTPFELDGDLATVEEVTINQESLDYLNQIISQQDGFDELAQELKKLNNLKTLALPGSVNAGTANVICSLVELAQPVTEGSLIAAGTACAISVVDLVPGDELVACPAATQAAGTATIAKTLQMVCEAYPRKISKFEIYPELPCLKAAKNMADPSPSMKIALEGNFTNGLDKRSVGEFITSSLSNFAIDKIAPEALQPEYYTEIREYVVDGMMNIIFTRPPNEAPYPWLDTPALVTATGEIDPSFIKWNISDIQNSKPESLQSDKQVDIFYLLDGKNDVTSLDASGKAMVQGIIEAWPAQPDQKFESSKRQIRTSRPPELVEFDMPTIIPNLNVRDKEAAKTWKQGTIVIRDDDRDFYRSSFTDTKEDAIAYTGFSHIDIGEQTDDVVIIHFDPMSSEHLWMNANSQTSGSVLAHLYIRDTCGNGDFVVENHPFEWPAPQCELILPCTPLQFERDENCRTRGGDSCTYGSPECARLADDCFYSPDNNFLDYLTIIRDYYENWKWPSNVFLDEIVNDDGTVGYYGKKAWKEILQERDRQALSEGEK